MNSFLLPLAAGALLALASCSAEGGSSQPSGKAETDTPPSSVGTAAKVSPSFDCAKAASDAEDLVCSDPALARLDRELTRVYALAQSDSYQTARSIAELKTMQRGWVKGRNDCWKAEDKRNCVVSAYAMRILELRQNYVNARSADANGISSGPVAFACEGLDFGIGAVFINSDPDVAYLKWRDNGVALTQVESGSGAKYQGTSFDGTYGLWSKGDDAVLSRPGEPDVKCKQEEIG